MTSELKTPGYFHDVIDSLSHTAVRSGITVGDIRPPRNLAPLSHAVGLEVVHDENSRAAGAGDAFGRLIVLHDPASDDHHRGLAMRMVAYIQAELEAPVATDPLFPDVAWDWLTEELDSPDVAFTDLGGTVTSKTSVRYGEISGPPRAFQVELRASWTAQETDLSGHLRAFARVLGNVAGLPPEGTSRWHSRKGT